MTLYQNAHNRVRRLWGNAKLYQCVRCAGPAHDWAYDGTDPTACMGVERCFYSVWPEFYMPLCRNCHRVFDAKWYEIVKVHVPPRPKPARGPKSLVTNPKTEREWSLYLRQQKRREW